MKVKLSSFKMRCQVEKYFDKQSIPQGLLTRADVVLALLRINTVESLHDAEILVGRPITKCPPALPPWPPKPVQSKKKEEKVASLKPNSFLPTTGAFQRYRKIRRGMTRGQLKTRGVTQRDISNWTKSGHITWSTA